MSTYFVTGGDGFIGSAFVDKARSDGHLVYVFDKAHGNDLANGAELNAAMKSVAPDWVIHLAATPGVSNGKDNGGSEACNDVFNTCQVLRAMNYGGAKRILFVSTGSAYGDGQNISHGENFGVLDEECADTRQTSFYASGKLACEKFLEAQHAAQGTQVVILRLGTIIGPGNAKGFVKDFVRKLKQNPKRLEVLGDGHQVKSYVHIHDMVGAMNSVIALDSPWPIEKFNVSLGHGASIRECVPWVCEEMGVSPEVVYGESKSGFFGDIPHIELANGKLLGIGWKPHITISQAVKSNVRWLLDHPELFG